MKNKKILITGGAGFIGSNLVNYYLKNNYIVTVIDNFNTSSKKSISIFKNHKNYKFIPGSINKNNIKLLIKNNDYIFHLAASVNVKKILEDPLSSMLNNLNSTKAVLYYANKYNKTLLITSSSEVYGIQKNRSLSEDDKITFGPSTKARWSYAISKLTDEFLALGYHSSNKLKVVVVRLFNTIGSTQTHKYGMVVPTFINQARKNLPITIFGTGKQIRTFTDVDEVVLCLSKLIKCKKAYGQVVNIGGKEKITIKKLALKIIKLTSSKSKIKIIPYKNVYNKNKDYEDMPVRIPSTKKLRALIKYGPIKNIDQILFKILNFK